MTLFIAAALLLSLLAGAFVARPLLRLKTGVPRAGWAAALAVLAVLGAGAGLYGWLGDRRWASGGALGAADRTIPRLARHLEREPQDLGGWLSLGRAYVALGNYSLALRCFQRANRLSNGGNAAALADMAEAMLLDGDSAQTAQAQELLERALRLDPSSPKALFYSAVITYQQGNLPLARERFAAMLKLPPPENVRIALQRQIDDIDAQLHGQGAGEVAQPTQSKFDPATAIHLHVTLSPALSQKVPTDASLFIFVRSPNGGAPLAAKRSAVRLPQDVDLSAADAMVAGRAVQPGQSVSVVARISASGSALAQSGDLYGEIRYVAGKSGAQALQIDKLNP
jgi:cytochrome c-type biogenesis protein CcmH